METAALSSASSVTLLFTEHTFVHLSPPMDWRQLGAPVWILFMLVSPTPQRMLNESITLALSPLGAYSTASFSPTPVACISKVFLPSVCKTGARTCLLSVFLPLFSFMEHLTLCISVYGPSLRSTETHAASDWF